MDKNFKDFWNDYYTNNKNSNMYPVWIDEYLPLMKNGGKIVELGAGNGDLSIYLKNKGFDVLSTDISNVALNNINEKDGEIKTLVLDLINPLPFDDNSFDVVIADLSLHYFNSRATIKITNEIYRVLNKGGILLARVNSTDDVNHGANGGLELEHNYFYVEGYNKRFFDERDINFYFGIFDSLSYTKKTIGKDNKIIFEVKCDKKWD